ncbi:hypothetical protein [Candidatus Palauibacter sp.]|uniref:hypothetical protein n=1 Tax=Candidatus Palauibacter sp. TaxID=3101350 RepID=UPI003CC52DF5
MLDSIVGGSERIISKHIRRSLVFDGNVDTAYAVDVVDPSVALEEIIERVFTGFEASSVVALA